MAKSKTVHLFISLLMTLQLVSACTWDSGSEPAPADPFGPSGAGETSSLPGPAESLTPDAPPEFNSMTPADTFVVSVSEMNGDFVRGWGNNLNDLSIKQLTGGFKDTYWITSAGQLLMNETVVSNLTVTDEEDGGKTYTFTLHQDLKWNNGEPITAHDYVAGILTYASEQFAAYGGGSLLGDGLAGYEEYRFGDSDVFAGVRLLGEHTFSATIEASRLPYFWETALVTFHPVYSSGWFPGNHIISDSSGSRFAYPVNDDLARISKTERFAPTVTCGPYAFAGFDGNSVSLTRNHYFKSSPEGLLPFFEYIIQREEADAQGVINGISDFRAGITATEDIRSARAGNYAAVHSYPRSGFAHLTFALDWGPTEDPAVRWAIAHMLDRSIIIDEALDGNGSTVDASYGQAQWTYLARQTELLGALTPITLDLGKANDFLDNSQWVFEADGTTAFNRSNVDASGSYLRHNAAGDVLHVRVASGIEAAGRAIEAGASANAPLAGMLFDIEIISFDLLLDHLYYDKFRMPAQRRYNAFQLAVDFTAVDDKYLYSHSDNRNSSMNPNAVADDLLDEIIINMRNLNHAATDEHADLWVEYQVRWQQLLPALPLYSNECNDIYNSILTQTPTSAYWAWHDAIMHISKQPWIHSE